MSTFDSLYQETFEKVFCFERRSWGGKWKGQQELRQRIDSLDLPGFDTIQEKLWSIRTRNTERPMCHICGKKTALIKDEFCTTCSVKCAARSKKRKEKIKQTSLEKYGVEHPTQSQRYRDTIQASKDELGYVPGSFGSPQYKAAIQEKYGVDNVFRSDVVKAKIVQTNMERYGVENPQQRHEIRARSKTTQIERYGQDGWNPIKVRETLIRRLGVDNPLKSKKVQEKVKATNIVRYGVPHTIQNHKVRAKMEQTNLKRYGVRHAMQNPEIFERAQRAQTQVRYKYKEFVMPSGDVRYIQGYEPQVLKYLLECGVPEDDIATARFDVPVIDYEFGGKRRKYFPDILVKSKNMLIEVKSTYTFSKDMEMNMAKQRGAKRAGYHHIIVIWEAKGDRICDIL